VPSARHVAASLKQLMPWSSLQGRHTPLPSVLICTHTGLAGVEAQAAAPADMLHVLVLLVQVRPSSEQLRPKGHVVALHNTHVPGPDLSSHTGWLGALDRQSKGPWQV
jgi:hypothetical protein